MKLTIEKLGRIEHAEIEIRPLTVFVGANNANKTWAAYALYGLLRFLTWRKPAVGGVRSMGTSLLKIQTESVRERVLNEVKAVVDRMPTGEADTTEIDISRRGLIESIDLPVEFTLFPEQLRTLLGLEGELADGCRATLQVPAEEFREQDAEVSIQLEHAQRSLRIHWTTEEPEIKLSVQLKSGASLEELRERARKLIRAFAQRFLSMGLVLPLPAERKVLASLYKHLPDRGSLGGVLSEPAADFMSFLITADALWRTREPSTAMLPVLDLLDARILGGSVGFQEMEGGQRLMFVPRGGPALPMHATSSMVRSLAGLELYLRHAAREGDTLIIDEPEMNAHPEAQIKLIELLALLVNKGIRVILTTHSSYIVDHLNNLICAGRLASGADQDEAAKAFKLGSKECFLSSDKVAAYQFENESADAPVRVNAIHADDDPDELIDWETFSRSTRYLGNLYGSELLPRIYREE